MSEQNSKCVVLVPCGASIAVACEESLRELENRGYVVRRIRGYSAIDVARCEIVTAALEEGFTETMWIDSDVGFHPDHVERLRSHDTPITCGLYPKKGRRAIACHVLPGSDKIQFGASGGLYQLMYAATGFLLVKRTVYETIQEELKLPTCNIETGIKLVPYFQPMIRDPDTKPWYLPEDFAFCERARQAGFKIFADTTIRLRHFGDYGYSWEDAGQEMKRFGDYEFHLT